MLVCMYVCLCVRLAVPLETVLEWSFMIFVWSFSDLKKTIKGVVVLLVKEKKEKKILSK